MLPTNFEVPYKAEGSHADDEYIRSLVFQLKVHKTPIPYLDRDRVEARCMFREFDMADFYPQPPKKNWTKKIAPKVLERQLYFYRIRRGELPYKLFRDECREHL